MTERRSRRRATTGVVACCIALACLLAGPAVLAQVDPGSDGPEAVPVLRLDGQGHGHGVGLSQWAAHDLALRGWSVGELLSLFYPGTTLGQAGGEMIVNVAAGPAIRLRFPGGGELRSSRDGPQAEGFPIVLGAGGQAIVEPTPGGYRISEPVAAMSTGEVQMAQVEGEECLIDCEGGPVTTTTTTTTPPDGPSEPGDDPDDGGPGSPATTPSTTPPPTTEPATESPSSTTTTGATTTTTEAPGPTSPTPVWAVPAAGGITEITARARSYRGVIEFTGGAGALRARNHVDVEDYLAGMGEVPGSWPAAAVAAQAVAARTYALRAMAISGEICDDDRCQYYVGHTRESPGQRAAVEATRGTVVTYNGGLAATFFSASGGEVSATPEEGFGNSIEVPYLQAVPAPSTDPRAWTAEIALADVGARLGYPGSVEDVRITRVGPSGRALDVTLDGDAGPVTVTAQDFRRQLQLRSTLYTLTLSVTDEPPPPVPAIADLSVPTAQTDALFTDPRPSAGARAVTATSPGAFPTSAVDGVDQAPAAAIAVVILTAVTAGWLGLLAPTDPGLGALAGFRRRRQY